ncbi:prepilin peptidase [Nesterenkonia ebinurensis]|uniref:prepilin peptidase n=1 Tax=Nesterenkonia ebinurensis TaxID=2608252 RepID=UPI00168B618B|nr:A24 family peptidase [Nesterenkonia ebinurensis]
MFSLIGQLLTSGSAAQIVAAVLLLAGGAAFAVCGTALAFIDLNQHRLPNRIIYPWAGCTFGLLVLVTFLLTDIAALGRAVTAGLSWGLLFLMVRLLHPPSLGMGDVKLAVVLGMYTGFISWETFAGGVVLSFLLGGLVSLWLLLTRRATSTSRIAFGPFLILGAAGALILS